MRRKPRRQKNLKTGRPPKPGGSDNERLASFPGSAYSDDQSAWNYLSYVLPELRFAGSTLPCKLRLREGEANTSPARRSRGRVGKRAFSKFFGEGIRTGSNASDRPRDVPPRTSLRWFDPPLQTAFAGG